MLQKYEEFLIATSYFNPKLWRTLPFKEAYFYERAQDGSYRFGWHSASE